MPEPPYLRIDTHVHVALLGPEPPPTRPVTANAPFMEPQPERGGMTLEMRHSAPLAVFLFYNKIEPHELSDTLLRQRSLDNIAHSSFNYVVCLALDAVYSPAGERRPELSSMWVSNEYVLELAAELKAMLPPEEQSRRGILLGASVHPYAPNFRERVTWCVDHGAVLLKWLPSAQQINLADDRVGAALEFLATARQGRPLPVLLHVGTELAILTTDPKTTSYDFLSWSTWDRFWNRLRPSEARWATPDLAGVRRNLDRGLNAGGCLILAHCGLPYFAPNFFKKWLEHSDFKVVREYLERHRGTDGIRGKCFADVSAVVTPFRKSYFDDIRKLPPGSVLAASDFPVPVFELSADLGENLEDLGAILNGEFERIIVPEGNLLDVNWRELQHAFPGHPMFENASQII